MLYVVSVLKGLVSCSDVFSAGGEEGVGLEAGEAGHAAVLGLYKVRPTGYTTTGQAFLWWWLREVVQVNTPSNLYTAWLISSFSLSSLKLWSPSTQKT